MVIPGKSCIQHIDFYQFGISKIIGRIVTWLVNQFSRITEARREKIRDICRGALMHGEPKFIWVPIVDRPCKDKALSLRTKFNAVLEETLVQHKEHYIMDMNHTLKNSQGSFDNTGTFTPDGKVTFWYNVDDNFKKFDKDPLLFKPTVIISNSHALHASKDKDNQRFRLPPPPPPHQQRYKQWDRHSWQDNHNYHKQKWTVGRR